MIPRDWQEYQLADCSVGDPEYGANTPALDFDPHLPRYIRITDITDEGALDNAKRASVAFDGNERYLLRDGDFLFARSGATVGKTFRYRGSVGQAIFAGYLIRFRPDEHILLSEYLEQYTQTAQYWAWVKSTLRAGAQPNINAQEYADLLIPVPPIAEQRAIIGVLAQWDRAISLTSQAVSLTRDRKLGLMQRLLTGQVRLPQFTSNAWVKRTLGDLFEERSETHRSDLPLLSITSKEGVVPRESVDRRDTSNEDKSRYLRICPGDIGYNTMRMWQGVSAVSSLEGIVSPAYTICIPRQNADAHFMGYLFKLPSTVNLFRRYSQGLVDDTLSLKFDAFSEIEVHVPPVDEQRAIARTLSMCDHEIDMLEHKRALLRRQKQGLMQQLVTGKVQVPA